MEKVVVTGLGMVSPLGLSVNESWKGIKDGVCGIDKITRFDVSELPTKVAGEVKGFEVEKYMTKKEAARMDRFCHYGMAAAVEAMEQSGLKEGEFDPFRAAVMLSAGVGGYETIETQIEKYLTRGPRHISPFFIPMIITNILSSHIAMKYNLKGQCHCIVTACAASTDSIGHSLRLIRHGYADIALAGGAEATIAVSAISGFANMNALSTKHDPKSASTPFDKDRDGFVMAEGGAVLVLESETHAKKRGAKILAELKGYGATGDAYHITSPAPSGEAAGKAMEDALSDAGIKPCELSYINAHGTGTPLNDLYETNAINRIFGEDAKNIPISSTKSMTGHMLGAAGATEAIFAIKAILDGFIPATIGLRNVDPELNLDYVPNEGRNAELKYAMSNSFGFGGHNGSLIFGKWED